MPSRILHVDLDAFFVEVCRQRNPELRDVELLVVGGRRDQRGVVQSASYGARAHGVRRIAQKVGEEGVETALAAVAQDDEALLGESADLVYHLLVLLRSRDLSLADVEQVLRERHG